MLLGIDLGCSTTVCATVSRGGVMVVRNDLAERLTPTLVTYTEKERLLGDAALTSLKSNAATTCRNFKNLLGATDLQQKQAAIEREFALAPIVQSEIHKLLGYQVGPDSVVTATEALSVFLKRLSQMGEAHVGAECPDCVVAVPTWLSDAGRRAVLDACSLAGLTCYKVMDHSTATALDYGLFRSSTFQEGQPQLVAFVDIGHGSATVTVAQYLPSKCTILAVEESTELGGRSMDRLITTYLAGEFKKRSGCDVLKKNAQTGAYANMKAFLKLEEAAEKAKKVLSANKETTVHLECLIGDEDLEATLTREQFEALCEPYRVGLRGLLEAAVAAAKLPAPDAIASVEICGGVTRVPFVQDAIQTVLGRPISKTVSADECVARGAAVMGAMLHPRHRVREFKMEELRRYPIYADFAQIAPLVVRAKDNTAIQSTAVLFERRHAARHRTSIKCQFTESPALRSLASSSFDMALSTGSEPQETILGAYRFQWPAELQQILKESAPSAIRLNLAFALDDNCQVAGEAEIVRDVVKTQKVAKSIEQKDELGVVTGHTTEYVDEQVKTVEKFALRAQLLRPVEGWVSSETLNVLKAKEEHLLKIDQETQRARHVANEILSLCFRIRTDLEGVVAPFATADQKKALVAASEKMEMWVEDNQGLTSAEYETRYNEINGEWMKVFQLYKNDVEAKLAEERRIADEARKQAEEARRLAEEAAQAQVKAQEKPVDITEADNEQMAENETTA